jgi:acetoin utilization deacetylase AcuC-like enzyme
MKTAFLSHPDFLRHDTGPRHPERPQRLEAIERVLKAASPWGESMWGQLEHLDFAVATDTDLERCHTREHIARVRQIAQRGGGQLDGDTHISPHSFDVARLAVGAAQRAVEAVVRGEVDNAFVAARPPGHHAESGQSSHSLWGFCLFNTVALAARYAQQNLGIGKVAILDFDVHQGNGTQEIFYEDPSVLFVSLHESPLFPYQGEANERGANAGEGTTLNFSLPAQSGAFRYRPVWEQVGETVKAFGPDLILLSAGYDAHQDDPLGHMLLDAEDYAWMIARAKQWASELCQGRLVAVLEGGYDVDALAESVAQTLLVLKSDE